MKKNNNKKPLTLDELVSYNHKILFPWMEERFVVKTEFNELKADVSELKTDVSGLKAEFSDFRDETTSSQDKILKKLDTLLTEKTAREYQEKKEKKLWAIVLKALQEHRILTPRDLEAISQLEIF